MALRGAVAEWLGRGLQSLVHQFESGRRLFDQAAYKIATDCRSYRTRQQPRMLESVVLEPAADERTACPAESHTSIGQARNASGRGSAPTWRGRKCSHRARRA